ncbi:hypothetical protein DV736_g342, partial [Chaetothyriales sp. CBS 134916]
MADAEPTPPADKQRTDNDDSFERPALSPVRKLSALAPKQTRAYSLPALTDIVPLGEASPERVRHGSFPGAAPPRFFIPGVTTAFIDGLPVQSYLIVGKPYTMQRPDNEGTNETIRITVDNRRLKYVLNVLQQPQKARACGNGPRASSDRRPVDPPPVVQLKVFDTTEGEKDVTMNYDSGFMLYASLEVARPIANGRMHSPPHPPVLTGVAVASAAYLERPNGPSGYFIFPDLSVRHEGWYRLKFSLFEAIKHPQDADCDRPFNQSADAVPGREIKIVQHQSMANRIEVSSTPFQVFSAKKFPGLEMSTDVSVALAQQGCRVRIRRDIRQRKRVVGDKPKRDDSNQEMSNLYTAQHHTRTGSLDSQYRDPRRTSIDSQYTRPTLSRDPSIVGMTQPGHNLPLGPQPSMGPPQVQRSSWDSSPIQSSTYSSGTAFDSRRPMMTQPTVLPPLPPPQITNPYDPAARPKQYDIPMPTSHKRSYSPAQYSQTDAMKQGARPNNPPPAQPWQAFKHGAPIEVDDGEDSDVDYPQYFTFRKSDKSYGANRYPDYSQLNYSLAETYQGETFFDSFNYFYGYDPAQGFVHYANPDDAQNLNLTYATSSSAIIRVDNRDVDASTGRLSARVESKSTYTSGLFIFDVKHAPFGCALWPALWLTDPSNWPMNGEIDVVEGMNSITGNQVTLHTTGGCKMNVKRKETGKVQHTDCHNTTDSNVGCGVRGAASTFGPAFNEAGGGIYAMELRDAGIRTWFFDRSSLPADLSALNTTTSATAAVTTAPDPYTWSKPLADFPSTECDISKHFRNQSIIANIDLCGQGAGATDSYTKQSQCSGTCTDYVTNAPGSTWDDAYWEFGGWWVFQAS